MAASPADCFAAMVAYEELPEWQGAVTACRVLSRDMKGRGRRVAYEVDARVRQVTYTLEQSYDEPNRIDSRYVEGDFRDFEGSWTFEPADEGTHVAVSASIDPGVKLPALLVRRVNGWVLSRSVQDLKRRVDGRP